MWSSRYKSAPKLRQTFLPFKPLQQSPSTQQSTDHNSAAKPALELPAELWDPILESQTVLVLKNFRLVCRHWAQVAPAWLFNTVYVDNYSESWQRLERLASSRHAHHVQKMQWNPLIVPLEPLDADIWRQYYPNLLANTTAIDSTRLYDAYRRCIRSACVIAIGMDLPSIDFSQLSDLHELLLEDDVDVERKCVDSTFWSNVHHQTSMHDSVSMWGHYPRFWTARRDYWDHPVYASLGVLFTILKPCMTLTDCRIDMWTYHWRSLITGHDHRWSSGFFTHPTIKKMQMTFKYCDVFHQPIDNGDVSVERQMQLAFQSLYKFPELEDITVQPQFTPPTGMFSEQYTLPEEHSDEDELPRHGLDCKKDESCDCLDWGETIREISSRSYDPPPGLYSRYIDAIHATLHLSLCTIPKLRTLVIYDATINMRTLIAWLCTQYSKCMQKPWNLEIHLRGYLILYGLDKQIFYQLMSTFGIKIYIDGTVKYYDMKIPSIVSTETVYNEVNQPIRRQKHDRTDETFWYTHPLPRKANQTIEVLAGPYAERVWEYVYQHYPSAMSQDAPLAAQKLVFANPPNWIENLAVRRSSKEELELCYCMSRQIDGEIRFGWTSNTWESIRPQSDRVLLVASLRRKYCDDDYDDWQRQDRDIDSDPGPTYMHRSLSIMLANGEMVVYGADGEPDIDYQMGL